MGYTTVSQWYVYSSRSINETAKKTKQLVYGKGCDLALTLVTVLTPSYPVLIGAEKKLKKKYGKVRAKIGNN